jgi:Na+-driven multidrug efflux pump
MAVATFQGLGRGGTAFFLSLARQFLLFVPLVLLLRSLFGLTGVWLALPAADVLSLVLSLSFLLRERGRLAGER